MSRHYVDRHDLIFRMLCLTLFQPHITPTKQHLFVDKVRTTLILSLYVALVIAELSLFFFVLCTGRDVMLLTGYFLR